LDTGATVSTISEDLYRQYLSHIDMYPVLDALYIECADGQEMLYLGYICTSITPHGMPIDILQECLFLVVPTSNYSSRVPVLIGTNIMSHLVDHTRGGSRNF
jgi:hypothetical protein